jgi:hypothetical protein
MFGLNQWSIALIIFIVMIISIGSLSYYSGLNSPGAIAIMLFAETLFFDAVLNILIPSKQFAATVVAAVIMITILFKEGV